MGVSQLVICKRKVHFPTRAKAEEARKKIARKDGDLVSVYGCPVCGGFHLTHHLRGKARREA